MGKIHSFSPFINSKSRILILGSMPGAESLRKAQYYGNNRNAFWKIMFDLLNYPYTDDYNEKKNMLLNNSIALWDVIESCVRRGSLDSAIHKDNPNDFTSLYNTYPNIEYIFFNGAKAYDTYRRKVHFVDNLTYSRLMSTSPAHAVNYEIKLKDWGKIISI